MDTLRMVLLMGGTGLILLSRLHVYRHLGVPPRAWLMIDLLIASGPAFGWYCREGGGHGILLAALWLAIGAGCYAIGVSVVTQVETKIQEKELPATNLIATGDHSLDTMRAEFDNWRESDRESPKDAIAAASKYARDRRSRITNQMTTH